MYLDSGIIVKLLIREPDSEYFNKVLSGHSLDSSELCLTEVSSALLAKERNGHLEIDERRLAMERLRELVEDDILRVHPLNRRVLDRATAMLKACHPKIPLRTLDALHVATCDLQESESLCATDQRMRAAAAQFAIQLIPRTLEEIRI